VGEWEVTEGASEKENTIYALNYRTNLAVKFARKSTKNLLSIYTDGVEIHKLGYK
jgi:hypothetical protein